MADDPFTPDDDFPSLHNPIRNLPWLDVNTEYQVFQHRPGLHNRLAEWVSGEVLVDAGRIVVKIPGTPPGIAQLGDFVVFDGETFWVEQADGFFQRFWPAGKDPGWSHRCLMPWEESP